MDENVRTWWSATSGKVGEYFVINLGKKVRMNSIQINFAEQDINPDAPKETDYHAYKLYVSDNGRDWKLIVDKSRNMVAIPHEYVEFPKPIETSFVKIENVHTPKEGKFALLDLRVFGFGYSDKPEIVKELSVKRNKDDERYASLSWNKVSNADGYLVRLVISLIFLINVSRSKIKRQPVYCSISLPKAYSIITALTAIMTVELQKASLSLNKKI